MPPMDADERATLAGWLDFYRATLIAKCDGLTEEQLRTASAPPSPLTLRGLVQHVTEVERTWFRRVLAGEAAPPVYPSSPGSAGHDGGFTPDDGPFSSARRLWEDEVAHARSACAARDLGDSAAFGEGRVTVRWVYSHMIAEYARHCGHADLLRERLDGATGV
ncbi:DinB family protein [Actinokineospora guangxiensis]|uniref:DinB family protein n=1 Tax=Actinokineospora guangxiensis TaxID=1490288 RepID=A0ABW0ER95_9PSEU